MKQFRCGVNSVYRIIILFFLRNGDVSTPVIARVSLSSSLENEKKEKLIVHNTSHTPIEKCPERKSKTRNRFQLRGGVRAGVSITHAQDFLLRYLPFFSLSWYKAVEQPAALHAEAATRGPLCMLRYSQASK